MRESYDFNEFGVCMNPECYTFKCDQGSFQVKTAFTQGFWLNGISIQLSMEGMGSPCSINGTHFSSEREAVNDAYSRIKKWLGRKDNVNKLIREADSGINPQLELF